LTDQIKRPDEGGDTSCKTGKDEQANAKSSQTGPKQKPAEFGGRKGPEPTRYGDWEKNGIISDF
jgi:hypothetical protein